MGLNLTSTAPSANAVPVLTHHGKLPEPDCFKTLGGLGAVGSCSTVHLADPLPVTPPLHPIGGAPTGSLSKLMVSAIAVVTTLDASSDKPIDVVNLSMFVTLIYALVRVAPRNRAGRQPRTPKWRRVVAVGYLWLSWASGHTSSGCDIFYGFVARMPILLVVQRIGCWR